MDPLPSAQPAPDSPGSPLFRQARELDARLRQRAKTRRRDDALDAFDLALCKRLGLFRLLGYSSVTAYAYAVNGCGASKTSDLIRIAERCERLPKIRAALLAGELDWCMAREIVNKATPADEGQWLAKAKVLSVREIRALVREEDPLYRRLLELTLQELAWVEAVADWIRKEHGPLSLGRAIALACRRMLQGGVVTPGSSAYRVLIHLCEACGEATRQTSEGRVPIGPEDLEQIECDAEVLDLREGPARLRRTAPPKIRNFVLGRDERCVVPGCRNRIVQFHHEDGWRKGHDPARCYGLCGAHHDARHRGFLRAEGSMPDMRFYLADGTYLGRAGDEQRAPAAADSAGGVDPEAPAFACAETASAEAAVPPRAAAAPAHEQAEGAPEPGAALAAAASVEATPGASARANAAPTAAAVPSPAKSVPGRARDQVGDALKALKALGVNLRAARGSLERVFQLEPGRAWDAGELVRAVLLELPLSG